MKTLTIIAGLTLLAFSLNAQKVTDFARAFSLTTTATFPNPSSSDFKEIKQNVTIRLMGSKVVITRLGTSTFLGSSDTLAVKKATYSSKDSCTKVTTIQGIKIESYPLQLYITYPKVDKKYRIDLMEYKDQVAVIGKTVLVQPSGNISISH